MQIHPLFSVKKAAEALGVEKQFLRDQLELGMIRGEKRRVGERDKWFIYHGEVRELRDTKRLHEMLEKATRISTDDLGDFFDDDDEPEHAAETGNGVVTGVEPSAATSDDACTDTPEGDASNITQPVMEVLSSDAIALAISEALVSLLEIIETTEKKGTRSRKMAARRKDVMKSTETSLACTAEGHSVGRAINDVFESLEMQSTLDALIELFENAPIEATSSRGLEPLASEVSSVESSPSAEVVKSQVFMGMDALEAPINQLAKTDKSLAESLIESLLQQDSVAPEFATEQAIEEVVADDLFVDDLFIENVELVEPGDVDFVTEGELVDAENEAISGSTSITIDEILQKLTSEFAFQLAEEKSRVKELEHQLELKNESLRLLPDLEKRLQDEMAVRESHQLEVAQLNEKILLLETSKQTPNRPWWKKLFGG